jgi:2-methylcitrate dehydratase
VAAALVEGQLTADQFNPEMLSSPDLLSLVDRSSVWWNEALEAHWPKANPATITMTTTDGQELSETMVFPPGHPNNPLPDDVLEQKFRQLTHKVLDSGQIDEVIGTTRRLEQLSDVRMLTDILRSRSQTG